MKKLFAFIVIIVLASSCTDNFMAKNMGGTQTIDLNPGQRLVNITWKETDLWILTKLDTTKPSVYTFKQESSLGIINGEVIINEH